MRGEVLDFDRTTQSGIISGDDGRRYAFVGAEVQRNEQVHPGERVDFEAYGDTARQIFRLAEAGSPGVRGLGSGAASGRSSHREARSSGEATAWTPPLEGSEHAAPVPDRSLWGWYVLALSMRLPLKGRARRREYWGFSLFSTLITIPLVILPFAVSESGENIAAWAPLVLYLLVVVGGSIKTSLRRLHDVGLSGWFYLLGLIPYLGGIFLFVVAVLPSQSRDNRWGPPAAPR